MYGERRDVYRVLVGKPEGKRPLGKPRCRWEDNIKVDMQEVGCCAWTGMMWLMLGKMAGSSDLYNFTACPFAGIPRNCTCAGRFCVLTGRRQAYLSQLYIHRVNALYRPRI